jgi:4-amino-4-deoxy-L-arabinose transferase-like glycosyltransferase
LRTALKQVKARSLIVDTLADFFGTASLTNAQTVRTTLLPLGQLAARLRIAVILVRHFTKTGKALMSRGMGSHAVLAASRSAMFIDRDPDNEGHSILAVFKSNLAATRPPSLTFSIVAENGTGKIEWHGRSDWAAEALCAATNESEKAGRMRRAAQQFLEAALETGPRSSKEITEEANTRGISSRTLERARKDLKVKPVKTRNGWWIRPWFTPPWTMVVVALALRLAVMGFVYTDRLDPARDHWTFGWETGRVARSIAVGQGFSSPYPEPTGATNLIPPFYAYLVAGVFRLFGIFTPSSAVAMLTLNNLFSSLTCLPVFLIARRVFGLRAAVRAGWIWAFFPYAVALPNVNVWDTTLTTLLLSLVVLATLHLERSTSLGPWLGYGALWAIAALTNPAVLSTLPFLGAWVWLRHWRRGENCTGAAFAASLVFLVAMAPWIWRCSQVYGRFVALRGGFGLEVLVGNSTDTSSPANWSVLPGENSGELAKLRRLGEPAYMAGKQREAREVIARRPLRFAGLTLRRILYTWTCLWGFPQPLGLDESGLPNVLVYSFVSLLAFAGLRRAIQDRRDGVIALVIPLIFFPIVSYLTHPEMRYRHPIDPVVVVFVGYGAVAVRRLTRLNKNGTASSVRTISAG